MSKIAFIFPGQGSQSPGMGKEVTEIYPEAKAVFEEADRILGRSISELCFNGAVDDLKDTRNSQPAIVTTSVALYRILSKLGVKPDFVAGHSLGEYSGLVASGAADFATAVQLVNKRAQLMADADPEGQGTMAAVLSVDRIALEEILTEARTAGPVEAANYNSPGQIVISGSKAGIAKAQELVAAKGGKFMPLAVSGAFHSSFMKRAADMFRASLNSVTWNEPVCPLISNVSARPAAVSELTENLYRQIYSPVLWEDTLQYLKEQGVTVFVEVGPGKVLSGLVKRTLKDVTILNCEDEASIQKTLTALKA